jgi:hypothetical protein
VATDTLPVFAGCPEGADVFEVDRNTGRRGGRLVRELAIFVETFQVVRAHLFLGIRGLCLRSTHVDILVAAFACCRFPFGLARSGGGAVSLLLNVTTTSAEVAPVSAVLLLPSVTRILESLRHHLLRNLLHHLRLLL